MYVGMYYRFGELVQKIAFENELVVVILLYYYSKSKYVKRGIDVVPLKFGPILPVFWMQVALHL